MQTLKLVLKQSEQAAATRFLAALRPKKLQQEVRRMMISATDGLDEWTVSQLGEFAIRLDRIASEEALWNSATLVLAEARHPPLGGARLVYATIAASRAT
jgi:hypothetical protein